MKNFINWLNINENINNEVWYHGSNNLFNSFKLGKYKKSQQLGFGIHFATDENFARLYGTYLYTCNIFPNKILDVQKIYNIGCPEELFARALYKGTGRQLYVSDNQFVIHLDFTPPKRAERLLRQFGYDAVLYEAKYGNLTFDSGQRGMRISNKSTSIVILDPNKITILNVEKQK